MDETTIGGLIAACIVLIGALTAYIKQRTKEIEKPAEKAREPSAEESAGGGISINSGRDVKVGRDFIGGDRNNTGKQ